ncbi:hotdog family protein [Pontixanthobacter aquaemixtae]|uniref:Uncharacterized protein n=1 Tax=Pontixanthobacter aquaemixtae TaxID=1958940 RepID=A0A844ZNH2_9SPHN|nr:hypothetical protein [Pontixanthobacter aquaemixtae]MXO89243.1 hypothetical protein [Pontixanthobacter aquaemixtae]
MGNTAPDIQFTHNRIVHDDGKVSFRCSGDLAAWPWLELHPHHPIAVQNLQYWASVEAARQRGTFDGTKWTALTWTRWRSGDAEIGGFAHGVSDIVEENGKQASRLTLFDAQDREICSMLSKGVEFRTRDFEAWRDKAKQSSGATVDLSAFEFAKVETVGSAGVGPALIGPLTGDDTPEANGLMTLENAFPPAHPYMSGSGDHVNATHLAEAAHQFVHLLEEGAPLRVARGDMRFTRYVELGRVFAIRLQERAENRASLVIEQSGHACTEITLNFERV